MRRSNLRARFLREDGDPADGNGAGGGGGGASGDKPEDTFTDPDTGDVYKFPPNTPTADMSAEQKAEYWRHKARKHEQRADAHKDYEDVKAELDALRAASLTDAEKALEQARKEAADEARRQVLAEMLPKRVQDNLRSALAGKLPDEKVVEVVGFVDYNKFLTDSGEIDTDKVKRYAESLTPAGNGWPDMGQGNHGSGSAGPSVQTGYDRWAARHKKASA